MLVKENINNHLLSFVWLMLFIMPNNLLFFGFVPIAFSLLYKRNVRKVVVAKYIVISLLITSTLFLAEHYITSKDIIRVAVLMLIFFNFGQLKGKKILKSYIYIGLFYLIISQFAGLFNVTYIYDIIRSYYASGLDDVEAVLLRSENFNIIDFGTTRLGGIYFNPNQYARNLQIMYITMLCESKQFSKKEFIIISPIVLLSIFATGSRTSLVVMIFICILYLYFTKKLSLKNIALISIIGTVLVVYLLINTNFQDFRVLKLDEGLDNSLGVKIKLMFSYINDISNPFILLFGNLSFGALTTGSNLYAGTDSDIGNILIMYGLVFYVLFIFFCILVYKKTLPKYRVIFCILLWMLSSSIICSYRMSAMFLLVLGLYYYRSLIEKNERTSQKNII